VIGEAFAVEYHRVQDGGVQIVDVVFVLDRVPAKVVNRPMRQATFDSATGQTHREAALNNEASGFGV
jgi:hypothetical protein